MREKDGRSVIAPNALWDNNAKIPKTKDKAKKGVFSIIHLHEKGLSK
jgi:hypothetical protein